MSFDKKNLALLKTLGRTLPQKIPQGSINIESQKNTNNKKKETSKNDKDPETFFRELIEKSPDGNIPKHLLSELREIEKEQQEIITPETQINNKLKQSESYTINKNEKDRLYNNKVKMTSEERELYSSFKRLLLEEDEL